MFFAELSLYELHRKPHEMVSDTSAIAVSPRALHSELMCPICLDLMKNTMTTKDVGWREGGRVGLVSAKTFSFHFFPG